MVSAIKIEISGHHEINDAGEKQKTVHRGNGLARTFGISQSYTLKIVGFRRRTTKEGRTITEIENGQNEIDWWMDLLGKSGEAFFIYAVIRSN